jgi:hypothetical protein
MPVKNSSGKPRGEPDTPAEKAARSQTGGNRHAGKRDIEQIWDEVQAKTREGLGWKPPKSTASI